MSFFGNNHFGSSWFGGYFGQGGGSAALQFRAAIAGIVSGNATVSSYAGARIYYGFRSQAAAYPSISFMVSGRTYDHNLGGPNATSTGTVEFRIASFSEATTDAIGQAIRDQFDGLTGTFSGVTIFRSLLADESDDIQPPKGGSGQPVFIIEFTFDISHRVSLPTYGA